LPVPGKGRNHTSARRHPCSPRRSDAKAGREDFREKRASTRTGDAETDVVESVGMLLRGRGGMRLEAVIAACAEHVRQLGSESLLSNLVEVKD
jgi:hypothetical protein